MTDIEMRELDAWVAINVMKWHRMTHAQAMGIVDFKGFSDEENEHLRKMDDFWYDSENKHVADVNGECDCGQHDTSFRPTKDSACMMAVLKKCAEKLNCDRIIIWQREDDFWCIDALELKGCYISESSFELAVCQFSKQLFS